MLMCIGATQSAGGEEANLRAGLQQYCFRCHGDGNGKVKGKVNLAESFAAERRVQAMDLNLVGKVIKALADNEMPPEDEKQPTETQRRRWIAQLDGILEEGLAQQPVLTKVPIRRMNRFQYNNAIKELFDLARDPFALPERTLHDYQGYFQPSTGKMPDSVIVGNRAMGKSQFLGAGNTLPGVAAFPKDNRAEHGFDNRGDHLTLSPVLMESFFSLSQSIVNSSGFPVHSRAWKTMFVAPDGMTGEELRLEGKRRLNVFLRRAFRKDVTREVAALYHRPFLRQFAAGKTFTESMKAAISAAMVSPRFLYLYSASDRGHKSPATDDFALGSRLSFFLWNSIPDDTLLDLASLGQLRDPTVLGAQVDRMINDQRLKNFCDSFALQWLKLDQMIAALPDNKRFRDYYFGGANGMIYMVGMHMMLEPLLLFETVLIENRPIMELVDPNFTYRSERLRGWYEHPEEKGRAAVVRVEFQREPILDRRWGGVITNAAMMTMTSSPLRTKPITRGAWLASTIFNDPPGPPPAEVPEIEEDDEKIEAQGQTLRDKVKQHVTNPQCAACHRKIDPLGFALENYDPVGRWRDRYRTGLPIDSSGTLFNRRAFEGVIDFKDALRAEKDRFARAFARHLLSYALGRKLDAGDRVAIDRIVANSAKDNYRFRTMIKEVVLSPSFVGN